MSDLRAILESHAAKNGKLNVQIFSADRREPDEEEPTPIQDYVLIEGDNDSIKFLGQLLIAYAEGNFGCSFDLHPQGAGSVHFSSTSTLGIYLHKKPCEDG